MAIRLASAPRINFDGVAHVLDQAVRDGVVPGAVILVARGDEVVYHAAFGARSLVPHRTPLDVDVVYDLSSLTKPLVTTTLLLHLVRERKVRFDDRLSRFLQNFGVYGKSPITIRHLLAHCSGLAAWRPFAEATASPTGLAALGSGGRRAAVYERIHRERLEYEPGTRAIYSDLGFILLGELIELFTHSRLDRAFANRVARPLGLHDVGFIDVSALQARRVVPVHERIAPTEYEPSLGRVLCGEVHDDNARAMGGVAGHAGLFATAADVHRIVARLRAAWRGDDDWLPQDVLREAWRRDGQVPESTWALGWDTPTAGASSGGQRISPTAVGHLGFTGTSIWIDLERDAHVILLSNRVHPSRDNEGIRELRPRVHDAVWEALDA